MSNNYSWDSLEAVPQDDIQPPTQMQSAKDTFLEAIKSSLRGKQQLATKYPGAGNIGLYAPDMVDIATMSPESRESALSGLEEQELAGRQVFSENMSENLVSSLIGAILGGTLAEPYLLPLGAGAGAAKPAAGAISAIGQAAKGAAVPAAQAGAISGATQYTLPEESRLVNALTGSLIGGSAGGLLGGGVQAFKEAMPSSIIARAAKDVPKERIIENTAAAKGTPAGLGNVLELPELSTFQQNVLKYIPFSGYQSNTRKVASDIDRASTSLVDRLTGGQPLSMVEAGEDIQRQLQSSAKDIRKTSSKNYQAIQDLADELGISFETKNLSEAAKEILVDLDKSPSLKRKQSPELLNDLRFFAGSSSPPPPKAPEQTFSSAFTGYRPKPSSPEPRTATMQEMNLLRAQIGEDAWSALTAGRRGEAGKYGKLKSALSEDIDDVISSNSAPELRDLAKKAKDYYIKNVTDLDQPLLKRFINDPNLTQSENIISNFVKTGSKQDRVKRMDLLARHLDEGTMNKLRAAFFTDKQGNPSLKPWDSLGKKQKEMMVPDAAIRDELQRLSTLSRINPEAFNQMFNPKTGQQALQFEALKTYAPQAAAGIGALLSGGNPIALGSLGATIGAGRMANKYLSSERIRDSIVKSILEGGPSQTAVPRKISPVLGGYGEGPKTELGWDELEVAE